MRFLRSSLERSKRTTQHAVTVRWVVRLLRSGLNPLRCLRGSVTRSNLRWKIPSAPSFPLYGRLPIG